MTTTADPTTPALEIGKSRTRKEDARLITGRTRWTDNITLPGMLHLAVVRSSVGARPDHRHRRRRGPGAARRHRRLHRGRPRAGRGEPAQRLADHARPEGPAGAAAGRRHACTSPVRSSPSWSPATAADRPRRDRARRRRLRRPAARAGHGGGARRGRHPAAPRPRHERERALGVRLRRGRHRRERPRRDRRGREGPRRDRRPAAVPPAAADPGVHGAALGRRRPDR